MRIALLGGTGDIGVGLAIRLAADSDHEVVIGSRDEEKAAEKAVEYESMLADAGINATIESSANPDTTAGHASSHSLYRPLT